MYSFALRTMALNSSRVVFDFAGTSMGPASCSVSDLSSGRSRLSTTRASRSTARASADFASTFFSGRTGVTIVIESFTASKTTMIVGRTSIASGMPIGSGLGAANSSISRTMS